MDLKYSFKLFFLKCIFEFMINTAQQGSNSVNGREKYFKTIILSSQLCSSKSLPGSWWRSCPVNGFPTYRHSRYGCLQVCFNRFTVTDFPAHPKRYYYIITKVFEKSTMSSECMFHCHAMYRAGGGCTDFFSSPVAVALVNTGFHDHVVFLDSF